MASFDKRKMSFDCKESSSLINLVLQKRNVPKEEIDI